MKQKLTDQLRALRDKEWVDNADMVLVTEAAVEIERLQRVEAAAKEVVEEYTPKRAAANSIYRLSEVLGGR